MTTSIRFELQTANTSFPVSAVDKYIKEAVRNVEAGLLKIDKRLPARVPTPLASCYRLDLDVHHFCPLSK